MSSDFANLMRSPEEQMYAQACLDFISAILRKESGAAISAQEYITEERRYFPQPGDSAAVIRQKRNARATAMATLAQEAGRPLMVPQPPPEPAPTQTAADHGIRPHPLRPGEQVQIAQADDVPATKAQARSLLEQVGFPIVSEKIWHMCDIFSYRTSRIM
jgi:hypothetical protein